MTIKNKWIFRVKQYNFYYDFYGNLKIKKNMFFVLYVINKDNSILKSKILQKKKKFHKKFP